MLKNLIFFIVIGTVLLFISIKLFPFAYDDAFIHFRIARNLALHGVPYFNLSENVYSTSSFIWTIFLSIIFIITHNLPHSIMIINPIITLLGAIVWVKILIKVTSNKISSIMRIFFLIAYVGILIPGSAGLMETPLAILFLGSATYLLMENKKIGWTVLGIAIFIRLELIVFIFIFGLSLLNLSKKQILKSLLFLIIPLIFLIIVIIYYYDTLIPNTVIAKRIVYSNSSNDVLHNIIYSLFPNLNFLIPFKAAYFFFFDYQILFYIPVIILALSVAGIPWYNYLKNKDKQWGLYLLLGGLSIASCYILTKIVIFDWYIPLFAIPLLSGFFSLSVPKQPLTRTTALILTVIPMYTFINYFGATFININYLPDANIKGRVTRYLEVGTLLNKIFEHKQLLTSEIGALGYTYNASIIDGAGLVSPAALKYYPMKIPEQRENALIGAIPPKFVIESNPDIIVTYPVFVEEFDKFYKTIDYVKIIVPGLSKDMSIKLKNNMIWSSDKLYIYIRGDLYQPMVVLYLYSHLDSSYQ